MRSKRRLRFRRVSVTGCPGNWFGVPVVVVVIGFVVVIVVVIVVVSVVVVVVSVVVVVVSGNLTAGQIPLQMLL